MEQKPAISSSGDPAYVNLKVREQEHDSVTHFRMKRVTQLKKLIDSYCQRQSMDSRCVRFMFKGNIVRAEATPEELGMEDNDEIDAVMLQRDRSLIFPPPPLRADLGTMQSPESPPGPRPPSPQPLLHIPGHDIITAAGNGDIARVRAHVIADPALVHETDRKCGRTALIWSSIFGHLEVCKFLVDCQADVNARDTDGRATALHLSSCKGHVEVCKFLVDCQADVNAKDTSRGTPLICSSMYGHVEVCKLLVECQADVNAKTRDGAGVIEWSYYRFGHKSTARYLRSVGAKGKILKADNDDDDDDDDDDDEGDDDDEEEEEDDDDDDDYDDDHYVDDDDTAHPTLLPLLSVAQSYRGMCVSAQLCDAQGAALFPFVRLPPRVRRPFAGAPVYNIFLLTHGERLRVVACALTGKLVRLLSLGVGRSSTTTTSTVSTTTAPTPITGTSKKRAITTTITTHYPTHFEPDRNRRACHKLMHFKVGRVAAKLMHWLAAAVGSKVGKEAEELCASGQCAAAVVPLKRAMYLGHLPSRALMAHMLLQGRQNVACDPNAAFKLVEKGARLGCHHCQGVMAICYCWGDGCERDEARSLELARESSGRGSRYGQDALGEFYRFGLGGVAQDHAQAVALYRLAAAQNLDGAQWILGYMYSEGLGVAQDDAEARRWYQLDAAQGYGTVRVGRRMPYTP